MKKLLPIIAILIAAGIGGGGGYFLKTQSVQTAAPDEAMHEAEHVEGDDKKSKKDKKKSDSHGKTTSNDVTYMKFSRQFVVPVVRGGKPEVMMIFDINIEINPSLVENAYSYEPRLRDAMLAKLLQIASEGVLTTVPENPEAMVEVKAALLEIARSIMGDGATDILLLDIGIQTY